jgi:hypothetical protein
MHSGDRWTGLPDGTDPTFRSRPSEVTRFPVFHRCNITLSATDFPIPRTETAHCMLGSTDGNGCGGNVPGAQVSGLEALQGVRRCRMCIARRRCSAHGSLFLAGTRQRASRRGSSPTFSSGLPTSACPRHRDRQRNRAHPDRARALRCRSPLRAVCCISSGPRQACGTSGAVAMRCTTTRDCRCNTLQRRWRRFSIVPGLVSRSVLSELCTQVPTGRTRRNNGTHTYTHTQSERDRGRGRGGESLTAGAVEGHRQTDG